MSEACIETFDIFPWSRKFETGIEKIDEQHKQMVRIINKLATGLGHQADPTLLNTLFDELSAYADLHFRCEEEIWASHFGEDPGVAEHRQMHHSFLHRLHELKEEKGGSPLQTAGEEVLMFLTRWLIHHILDSDMRLARTAKALDAGMPLEQAKSHSERQMSHASPALTDTLLTLSSRTLELMRERAERVRIQQSLEASERQEKAFSDTLMRSVPGLLYLFDDNLHLVRWNDRLGELTGYSPDELANRPLLDFFEERHHADVLKNIESVFHRDYVEAEGKLRVKDGTLIPFMFTCVPLLIDGEMYFVGAGVDISRHRQAEKRLRLLSSSIEQASESILITDVDGNIKYINPAFSKLTGYSEAEAIGRNPSILSSGKQDEAFYRELWETISGGSPWQGRVVDRRKDGSFYPARLTISPVRDRQGKIESYVGIQQDLSAYEDLEMQFRQAQKMEAIGTLVGGIAHDFNNMLAGIMGNLYLVKQRVRDMPEVNQKLAGIEQLSMRAADMIQQLLTFARKSQVSMQVLPLPSFVKETVKFIGSSIPENITIEQQICNDQLNVRGDSTQLHQVLLNLINNARDAVAETPEPCIRIRLEPFEADEAFLQRHPFVKAGAYAHLSVADNGCGIPEQLIDHVFEPFFTTKEHGKGTGLGLAMVFGAIESHHGYSIVENGDTQGACFHIYLPLLQQTHDAPSAHIEHGVIQGAGEWILFVDDEPQVLSVGRELLENMGYRVLCASDGQQAIEVFREHAHAIKLVIMDMVMPNLGGVEAFRRISDINPHVKAIFATGYDRDTTPPDKLPSGSIVLSKPYDVATLSRTIRDRLQA